jgi:hypothetical protein
MALQESNKVFIVTFDIIKDWTENGLMQTNGDVYKSNRFAENDD